MHDETRLLPGPLSPINAANETTLRSSSALAHRRSHPREAPDKPDARHPPGSPVIALAECPSDADRIFRRWRAERHTMAAATKDARRRPRSCTVAVVGSARHDVVCLAACYTPFLTAQVHGALRHGCLLGRDPASSGALARRSARGSGEAWRSGSPQQHLRRHPLSPSRVQVPGHHDDAPVEQPVEDVPLGPAGVRLLPGGQDRSRRRRARR
jgi:hypothetical protein